MSLPIRFDESAQPRRGSRFSARYVSCRRAWLRKIRRTLVGTKLALRHLEKQNRRSFPQARSRNFVYLHVASICRVFGKVRFGGFLEPRQRAARMETGGRRSDASERILANDARLPRETSAKSAGGFHDARNGRCPEQGDLRAIFDHRQQPLGDVA